jgi:L-seryl-tRNA(Ser) seleniumtransferase
LLQQLEHLSATILDGESMIGGGSTPEQPLPTALIAISASNPQQWECRLRGHTPPVIARIAGDRLLLDLRTVFPEQEPELAAALRALT